MTAKEQEMVSEARNILIALNMAQAMVNNYVWFNPDCTLPRELIEIGRMAMIEHLAKEYVEGVRIIKELES